MIIYLSIIYFKILSFYFLQAIQGCSYYRLLCNNLNIYFTYEPWKGQSPTLSQANCVTVYLMQTGCAQLQIIVTWTYEDLFSFATNSLSKGSFLLRSIIKKQNISPIIWLAKRTRIIHHNHAATDDQIWKNFAIDQPMTSKMQLSCRLMHC